MRYLVIFMLVFALFMFGRGNGCHFGIGINGSGPTKTETRDLANFRTVSIDISGDILIEPSETFRAEVSAQENLLPVLKTEIEGETLRIYFSENVSHHDGLKITLYVPSIDGISLNGSADIAARAPLRGEKMSINVSGSGNIRAESVEGGKLSCDMNGSGDLHLAGKITDLNVDISGSADVDALNLAAQNVEVGINGSGNFRCDAAQSLRADVSGSGDVRYRGNPAVHSSINGSGEVSKMD